MALVLMDSLSGFGAHARIRTGDLRLTKAMLYHLSYVGLDGLKVYLLTVALPDNGPGAIHTRRQDMPPTIDDILERARGRLQRVEPRQAAEEQARGALLVDTRPAPQRANQGEIPGAIVIDRTVLEWRLDPLSPDRIAQATDHRVRIILVCEDGYSSSLAAASLQDIGLVNATDVIGGFQAWKAAGLPIER
jgi:rhodanese-related sulfurtransferase